MSIAQTKAAGKPTMPIRLRPSRREGAYILYKVKDKGSDFARIARNLNINPTNISKVVSGQRRSARTEFEIARLLGKASWDEVVLEARSEIQKKPVEVILQEMEQEKLASLKAINETADEQEAIHGGDWSAGLRQLKKELAAGLHKNEEAEHE